MDEPSVTDRGRGPSVVAVHGQPGLAVDFDAVFALLCDDHRVIAADRPGYGANPEGPRGLLGNARWLAELIERRGAAPVTVVGHSYGGGIAILLAAERPDLVSGLVLVGSVGRADSLGTLDRVLALPFAGEALAAAGLVAVGRVLPHLRGLAGRVPVPGRAWLEASLPDRGYAEVASTPGRRVWRSFAFEQRALVQEIGAVEAALPAVSVPAVVVCGTWDVVVPPSVATAVAAAVTGAELVCVARTGHFVPRDAPWVVADAVRRVEASSPPGADGPATHR